MLSAPFPEFNSALSNASKPFCRVTVFVLKLFYGLKVLHTFNNSMIQKYRTGNIASMLNSLKDKSFLIIGDSNRYQKSIVIDDWNQLLLIGIDYRFINRSRLIIIKSVHRKLWFESERYCLPKQNRKTWEYVRVIPLAFPVYTSWSTYRSYATIYKW